MNVRDDPKLPQVYRRATKYILVALAPGIILTFFFAGEVLAQWQGKEFAVVSSGVLQILVVGTLFNALAYVPTNLLLGLGHPDLPAKLGVLELLVYLPAAYFLTRRFGIVGAASAFAGRVALDAILLFVAAWRLCPSIRRTGDHSLLKTMGLLLAFLGGIAIVHSLALGILNQGLLVAFELGVYAILVIITVLDNTDRQILSRTLLSLGRYSKSSVRLISTSHGVPVFWGSVSTTTALLSCPSAEPVEAPLDARTKPPFDKLRARFRQATVVVLVEVRKIMHNRHRTQSPNLVLQRDHWVTIATMVVIAVFAYFLFRFAVQDIIPRESFTIAYGVAATSIAGLLLFRVGPKAII